MANKLPRDRPRISFPGEWMESTRKTALETLRESVVNASPGDVAEMCLELVMASQDPYAVAQWLQGCLTKIPAKKQEMAV